MYQLSLLMFSMLSTRTSLDFRINLLLHGPVLLSNSLTTPTLLDSIPSTNLSLEITLLILLLTSQESSIELHLHLCTRESSQLGRLRTPNPSCTSKVLNSQIFLAISVVKFSILDSKLPQVVKLVQTSTFSMITLTAARRAPQSALLVNLFLKMLPNVSPGIRRESTLVFKMLKDSESLLSWVSLVLALVPMLASLKSPKLLKPVTITYLVGDTGNTNLSVILPLQPELVLKVSTTVTELFRPTKSRLLLDLTSWILKVFLSLWASTTMFSLVNSSPWLKNHPLKQALSFTLVSFGSLTVDVPKLPKLRPVCRSLVKPKVLTCLSLELKEARELTLDSTRLMANPTRLSLLLRMEIIALLVCLTAPCLSLD